ncbi:MAG: type IV pili methyl-accepting chemotaxis transducer N-terminal domain-containing protein [Paracoccaceae bacterium]
MIDRRSVLLGLSAGALVVRDPPALARVPDPALAARRRIDVACRQRMLTQRMAKSLLLAHLGVERERHLEQARAAHALFARGLDDLCHGGPSTGPAREGSVDASFGRVRTLRLDYGDAVEAGIVSEARDRAALDRVVALDPGILDETNAAVGLVERACGGAAIPHHLAIALNIAGRQRMFGQKMSKECAMIAAGYAPAPTRAALSTTAGLFGASLDALRGGLAAVGLRAPRTAALRGRLALVADAWGAMRPVLDSVAGGAAVTRPTLETVAALDDLVLHTTEEAVSLYEDEG